MAIKASSKREKGQRLQRLIAEKISKLLGIPWGKDELIASRESGQQGTDVRLIGKALKEFPFSIETKNQETWSIPKWTKQAKENQKKGTDWLLICKKNRTDPVVIMDVEVFFKLYEKILKRGNDG
jgi:hypothetical protein